MFSFFRRKTKKNPALDESFDRVINEINNLDDKDNPRKIEHYILDSCEHIISTAKEIDSLKNQYKILSDHLEDVEKIISMDNETKKAFRDLSENVYNLTQRKRVYKESEKRLNDETFLLLQEHEQTVVEDIKRMEENERYRDRINQDIKYLEAEKSHLEIEKDYLSDLIQKLKIASIAIFMVIIGVVCAWLMFNETVQEARLPFIIVIFIGVLAAFVLFLLVQNKRGEYRKIIKGLNKNISLLNIARMRFVNVSKALSYEMETYDVRNSQELIYLWEQYMLMVKELEAYKKNNIDLTYYLDRLYKLFKSLGLKYERKWIEQVGLMINEEKMLSIRINILERRSGIKEQIHINNRNIGSEREEIDRLMKEHDFYVPEVIEIINSVDKICGRTTGIRMASSGV